MGVLSTKTKTRTASTKLVLWHILRVYGIPLHIIQIIEKFYHNFTCRLTEDNLAKSCGSRNEHEPQLRHHRKAGQ